jgi:PAS domain S-box-containing protein
MVFTRDRRITRYNPKFAQMYGYVGHDIVGMPAARALPIRRGVRGSRAHRGPLLSQGTPFQKELYMRRRDGSDLWVNLIGYLLNLGDPARGRFGSRRIAARSNRWRTRSTARSAGPSACWPRWWTAPKTASSPPTPRAAS